MIRAPRVRWRAVVCTSVVAAALCGASATWPIDKPAFASGGGVGIDTSARASGPVTITSASTGLLWSANHAGGAVTVSIRNTSTAPLTASAWWILASPTDGSPWVDPTVESAHISVQVAADASSTLAIAPPPTVAVRPGTYRLSVWAHTTDPSTGASMPSDGRAVFPNVQVLPAATDVTHSAGSSSELWIADARPAGRWHDGQRARLRVELANASAQERTAQVWWSLAPPSGWGAGSTAEVSARSATVTTTLPATTLTTLDIPMRAVENLDVDRVRVWLDESGPTGDVPQDVVAVNPPS